MMEELHEEGFTFIFLTLTSKNVTAEEVPKIMSKMNEAVNQRFLKYKDIKKRFHGTIRKFELTRNVYKYKNGKLIKDKFGNKVIDKEKNGLVKYLIHIYI